MHVRRIATVLATVALAGFAIPARAQDNYEIQVYGAATVAPGATMIELHSNFTANGRTSATDGLLPTNHAFHETLELTHGFTPYFEVGFYLFTSARMGQGWDWVGDHIRPRLRIPESWHWPVGVSLSQEFGYQRRAFSQDTWSWEIRPIVDQQVGRWYWAIDPSLERSLTRGTGFEFAPNVALTYDATHAVTVGVEYYAALGAIGHFDAARAQQHQIFPVLDLNLAPEWEINAGLGFGLTPATDRLILKTIIGRRF